MKLPNKQCAIDAAIAMVKDGDTVTHWSPMVRAT